MMRSGEYVRLLKEHEENITACSPAAADDTVTLGGAPR